MLNNVNNLVEQFQFPPEAVEGVAALGASQIAPGVTRYSGHDQGIAYRFFIHTEYNKAKSEAAHYEVFDEIEMIEWYTDKFSRPPERVRFLPESMLHIDDLTGKITGTYADAYVRFKQGLTAPGLPLEKWGVLGVGEVATLSANGIYSVEQFAALPRDRVQGKFSKEFVDAYDRAKQFLNAKENRMEADKQGAEILELAKKNAKLENEIEMLKEALTQTVPQVDKTSKKMRGRPRKIKEPSGDQVLPQS